MGLSDCHPDPELMRKIVLTIAEFLDNEDNKDCLYTLMMTYFREKALKSDLSTVFVIVYGEDTLLGSVPKSTHRRQTIGSSFTS